jgi:CubicO group peptidase (beta-lactamase class C family)
MPAPRRALPLREADAIVREACFRRFTAAVLRVERRGRVVFERAYGSLDACGAPATEVTTRFDLASLTKVVVASAALDLAARGRLALDLPLVEILTEWRGDRAKARITPRMLLAHTSGMHSGANYLTLLRENVTQYALARPLNAEPGAGVLYSDLGFIALGLALERIERCSLEEIVARFGDALGLEATGFRPRANEPIPATEADAWRGRVRAAVHDEKAHLMLGSAGHAGLFGSARDVARVTEATLAPLCGRGERGLAAPLAREAVREWGADPVLRRGLGWALKTTNENSCGTLLSHESFGHTGFTGTSAWADPTRDISVVLLTNGVYYGRSDLRDLRAAVCDAVVKEV